MRAVVIGAGVAGTASAAGLADFADVVVLERDELPDTPDPRRGSPQDRQLHNLLTQAQVHLEALLPGFRDGLLSAGGTEASVADQTEVFELGTAMPSRPLGLRIWSAPRPLVEHVARALLPSGVRILQRTEVTGLAVDGGSVIGVEVDGPNGREVMPADVVVDASGAASRADVWLTAAGAAVPHVEALEVEKWYATTSVHRPQDRCGDPTFALTFPTPPRTRGGLVSPDGAHRWRVSMSGRTGDPVPRTFDEVITYAATLEAPTIAGWLARGQPDGAVAVHRRPRATWRRHDWLPRPLVGFLPVGDSLGCLNPLFGQGMSVAAWQAALLREALVQPDDLATATATYLRGAAGACWRAWSLGQLADPPADGSVPRLEPEEWTGLAALVHADPAMHRRYVGMWHLLESVTFLDEPEVRARISQHKAVAT